MNRQIYTLVLGLLIISFLLPISASNNCPTTYNLIDVDTGYENYAYMCSQQDSTFAYGCETNTGNLLFNGKPFKIDTKTNPNLFTNCSTNTTNKTLDFWSAFWTLFFNNFTDKKIVNSTIIDTTIKSADIEEIIAHPQENTQTTKKEEIILGGVKPTPSTLDNWKLALEKTSNKGTTWIGKLASNGPLDNVMREDKGRNTIIYAPNTDFSKPIDIIYFFHGMRGFCEISRDKFKSCGESDMSDRIIPQSDKLISQNRNFVIVFPELPWSAGNDNTRYKLRQHMMWSTGDSDFEALQKDVIDILKTKFNDNLELTLGNIELVGHSLGGAALIYAARQPNNTNNYLMKIKPNIIKMSDADYCWEGVNGTQLIYNNYIKTNNTKMYLMVQDISQSGVGSPTANTLFFINNHNTKQCSTKPDITLAPKLTANGTGYVVPNTGNKIIYVPLKIDHINIGRMSLSFYPKEQSIS